jgi:hypothetical protein
MLGVTPVSVSDRSTMDPKGLGQGRGPRKTLAASTLVATISITRVSITSNFSRRPRPTGQQMPVRAAYFAAEQSPVDREWIMAGAFSAVGRRPRV